MSFALPVMDVTSGPLTVVHRNTMYVMKTPAKDASTTLTQNWGSCACSKLSV